MIKIVPGKTNLEELGYSDSRFLDDGRESEDSKNSFVFGSRAWEDADDTSAWVLRTEDKKLIGEIDWSFSTSKGQYAEEWQSKCNLDDNDVYLDRIDIWDKGKGYGSSALNQKHNDWKSKGKDSVTLLPSAAIFPMSYRQSPTAKFFRSDGHVKTDQKRLVDWYKRQGYEKSNKCTHKPNCDNDLSCYLTKTLF